MTGIICGTEFDTFVSTTLMPLVAYATIITSIFVALSFMVGRAMANPKLTLWSKTEAIQLIISVFSVVFITMTVNMFCGINMGEIGKIFLDKDFETKNIYEAADDYISGAATYAHSAMIAVRYHLEAYTILSFLNAFECDFGGLGCLFGYSGNNMQPFGGYGATTAALNTFFNSSVIAYFTAMNFLFILLFVYKGFVFLFLPLGIFLRALPFMRSFGALLIALALSFLIVYPLMLGVFWLMKDVLLMIPEVPPDETPLDSFFYEDVFPNEEGAGSAGQSAAAAFVGESAVYDTYFKADDNVPGVIMYAATAFVAAVFFPTVALLATIASVSYLARLYGEEINLSKLTQLV